MTRTYKPVPPDKQKRRGKLTKSEQDQVKALAPTKTVEEIALQLNRGPKVIRQYLLENLMVVPQGETLDEKKWDYIQLKKEVKKSPEYKQLLSELTQNELQYFEHAYAKLLGQFKEELLPTEEAQAYQLVKFDILMSRNMRARQKVMHGINRLQKTIDKLYRSCNKDILNLSDNDRLVLSRSEETLASLRSTQNSSTAEYERLQKSHASIMRDLKSTRDQRYAKVEASKMTFVELLKGLQNEEFREKEAEVLSMMKAAADKERERLSQSHEYEDGAYDQPLLNADTVGPEEEIKKEVDDGENGTDNGL